MRSSIIAPVAILVLALHTTTTYPPCAKVAEMTKLISLSKELQLQVQRQVANVPTEHVIKLSLP